MSIKVAIASDNIGYGRKDEIIDYLENEKGIEVINLVKNKEEGVNTFCDQADKMAELIQRDECRLGIYVCGTGIGFTCQINKHWGIRATTVSDPYSAKRARLSNNAQVIGLGARVCGLEYMKMIIDAWLDEPFNWETARDNSKKNLLKAEENDNKWLQKPDYVAWNMGFRPEEN